MAVRRAAVPDAEEEKEEKKTAVKTVDELLIDYAEETMRPIQSQDLEDMAYRLVSIIQGFSLEWIVTNELEEEQDDDKDIGEYIRLYIWYASKCKTRANEGFHREADIEEETSDPESETLDIESCYPKLLAPFS